jgi:heptosyltransferase-3
MHTDSDARRVLVYRIGSLGDTIVSLPCLHLIERRYPNAERILLTNFPVHAKAPAAAAILNGSNLIHGYMRYTIGTRDPRELLRLALQIRRFKPDVLVYLMPLRSVASVRRDKQFLQFAAGVKHMIGLPDAKSGFEERNQVNGVFESEAARLARGLTELGDVATDDPANWDLRLTAIEKETARNVLGKLATMPLIVCGPGTKMQAKDWGQDNWRALLSKLQSTYSNYGLVLIGAKEDSEICEYASRDWVGPKMNLCGRLNPRESAAVLEYAPVFLGPDSGPMHLAACVGTPCVIAFSARGLPGVWFPAGRGHQVLYRHVSCAGCNLETCIAEGRRCLSSITIDEMAAAVHSVVSGASARRPVNP